MNKSPPPEQSKAQDIAPTIVPSAKGRAMLSILHQYGLTEWWTPEKILDSQFTKLGLLLSHAYEHVPYYRKALKGCGITDPAHVTAEEWARVPILKRADIQVAGENLHSKSIPRGHGRVSSIHTSGTTGRPIRVLRTERSNLFWCAFTIREHLWHRRNFIGKLAVIRNSEKGEDLYPDGTRSPRWELSSHIFKTGPTISLNINSTVAEQVDWLQRENPDYLLSHPTNIQRLAAYCLEKETHLEKLRQVITISEILRPDVRDVCRKAWNASIADMYTGRDVGYLALQCPEHEHYHVQSEGIYVEVLDDVGKACGPGETGRVVVTPLDNFAMPLIRYEIGDFAEVGPPCPCGRGLPVLSRIIGRQQDMVTLAGGEKRWTLLSAGNIEMFLGIAPVRQYQFVQNDLETIEVRLVVDRELTEKEKEGIREWIVAKLNHPFTVTFSFVDDIPRTASGKYQDFISRIEA